MDRLKKRAEELNILLSDEQIDMFRKYYDMLIETNKVMNLTAITELDEVITKHFIDSISLVKVAHDLFKYTADTHNSATSSISPNKNEKDIFSIHYYDNIDINNKINNNITILDLGTGAGFPGIPLKIIFPRVEIVLMDSLNKRVKFLQNVIDELKLSNITAIHGRAEEMAGKKEYREKFDICISRAVANLSTLSEYCIPFVKKEGHFISYKSSDIDEELSKAKNAIKILGGNLTAVKKLTLPASDIERSFVIIEKVRNTPKSYPRKAGTASKNPL